MSDASADRRRQHVLDAMREIVLAYPMLIGLDPLRRRIQSLVTTPAVDDDLVRTAFSPSLDDTCPGGSLEPLRRVAARLYLHERDRPRPPIGATGTELTKGDLYRRGWSPDLIRKHIGPADVPSVGPQPGRYLRARIEALEQDPRLARVLERARATRAAAGASRDATQSPEEALPPTQGTPAHAWTLDEPTDAQGHEALELALSASPLAITEAVMAGSPDAQAAGLLLAMVHHARVACTSLPDDLARRFRWDTATVSVLEIASAKRGASSYEPAEPPRQLETLTARDALLAVLERHPDLATYALLVNWGWDKRARRLVEDLILAHYLPTAAPFRKGASRAS